MAVHVRPAFGNEQALFTVLQERHFLQGLIF
jgi:hypothetical protein